MENTVDSSRIVIKRSSLQAPKRDRAKFFRGMIIGVGIGSGVMLGGLRHGQHQLDLADQLKCVTQVMGPDATVEQLGLNRYIIDQYNDNPGEYNMLRNGWNSVGFNDKPHQPTMTLWRLAKCKVPVLRKERAQGRILTL